MVNLALFIRNEDIKSLLKQQVNTSTRLSSNNPLLYLSIVDDYILASNQTIDDNDREYVISDIVVQIIQDEYQKYCDTSNVSSISRENLQYMLAFVYQEGKDLANLGGILVLYFMYARLDVGITQNQVVSQIKMIFSNLTRIRDIGVNIIRDRLIEDEIKSRRKNYQRHLRQSLPNRGYTQLIERDLEVEKLKYTINNYRNILVIGIDGVGKSTIVETVIEQIITSSEQEFNILWLDLTDQPDIERIIRQYYIHTRDFNVLKQQLSTVSTIIIADNPTSQHIQYLDNNFPLAKIVAISNKIPYKADFWHHIYQIKPLNPISCQQLIQYILTRYDGYTLNAHTISDIILTSKGVPLDIITLVTHYCQEQVETTRYVEKYLALTRHAWLDINQVIGFWNLELSSDDIFHNPYVDVIIMDGKFHVRLRDHLFVQFDPQIIPFINRAIERNSLLESPIFPDVLYGLMKYEIAFNELWIEHAFIRYPERVTQWISWLELASLKINDSRLYAEIIIALSVYHRLMGQAVKYMEVLERINTLATEVELIRCLRLTGKYIIALNKLESLINRRYAASIQNELLLLKAQIYIDIRNLDEAAKLLQQIKSLNDWSTYRFTFAELEILLSGNTSIDIYGDYEHPEGLVNSYHHYLMGFQYFMTDTALAVEHFLRGLQIASQQSISNKVVIGRYLSNIGACHIKLGNIFEAEQYLVQALHIQNASDDKLGMIYTEKSFDELDKLKRR